MPQTPKEPDLFSLCDGTFILGLARYLFEKKLIKALKD
jgi:hypothetical protein